MNAFIVIPCLNEEKTLSATAASLGFGTGKSAAGTYLLLVDNGSTDNTLQVARTIQRNSPTGQVAIGEERIRGYVPPRHKGNLIAREIAESKCISEAECFIVQADADTLYDSGYVEILKDSFGSHGGGVLVESCSNYPLGFQDTHREYVNLCQKVDSEFESLLADHPEDVIMDDKTCGYSLSDYFAWGGHLREFNRCGDEIHSETARLYIRAKTTGCKRVRVSEAVARHSMRRAIECPSFDFSTAGFPREDSWKKKWRTLYTGTDSVETFSYSKKNLGIKVAIHYRRQHLLALFLILPLHVSITLGIESALAKYKGVRSIVKRLPKRNAEDLRLRPGVFIEDALDFIEPFRA